MTRFLFLFVQTLLFAFASAQQTIHFKIGNLPAEPKGYDLFLAGSFNGWKPGDIAWKFNRMEDGGFFLDAKLAPGTYEYKITRGSWMEVECKANGNAQGNRTLKADAEQTVILDVEQWSDNFKAPEKLHTASQNVTIIDTAFYIPQLKRKRAVSIYLPANYSKTKGRYPVLYLHDGQNVFDDARSYAGEWGVDEFLDSTKLKNCIVVAVDNGTTKRMNEYNPYDHVSFGKGEGAAYIDFLAKTLKPYIDKRYRTKKDKASTTLAGSSMGGLISMYAVLKYPKVFGGAGVFSPAFWVGPSIFDDIKLKGKKVKSHIYFYAGKQEGETMVPYMLKAFEQMAAVSKSKMTVVVRDEGKHNEATWRQEFPLFYKWIVSK
ncbi:MAG TPA: alpha/beta hydrolase-fold protein [Chitinophagaceae bacterium]|jgi:predicted alpha/beta superfamily hydrolase|nr:alpha/beta hydrolase-fold protein [Chitinophagaceae bacterium]